MTKINLKSEEEIKIMAEGGKKLAKIKDALKEAVKEGVKASDIEKLAVRLIIESGGKASFKMVPEYFWATCINVNEGLVHGIPGDKIVFKKGDVVSVDVGLFYKGFHTDTSFTVLVDGSKDVKEFLADGEKALEEAISKSIPGGRIFDISDAIQRRIESKGHSVIRALVGHGVGRELHEDPQVPCFTFGRREDSLKLSPGLVLAIEVMYAAGSPNVVKEADGWTISTADGKISALFEETVAVTPSGPLVLTGGKQ